MISASLVPLKRFHFCSRSAPKSFSIFLLPSSIPLSFLRHTTAQPWAAGQLLFAWPTATLLHINNWLWRSWGCFFLGWHVPSLFRLSSLGAPSWRDVQLNLLRPRPKSLPSLTIRSLHNVLWHGFKFISFNSSPFPEAHSFLVMLFGVLVSFLLCEDWLSKVWSFWSLSFSSLLLAACIYHPFRSALLPPPSPPPNTLLCSLVFSLAQDVDYESGFFVSPSLLGFFLPSTDQVVSRYLGPKPI